MNRNNSTQSIVLHIFLSDFYREGMKELGKYKYESKILEIRRDEDHQARRLKYQPAKEIDSKRSQSKKSTSQSTLHSMIFNRDESSSSSSSSSSSFKSSSLPSTSKMLSVQKTATSTNPQILVILIQTKKSSKSSLQINNNIL